MAGVLREQGKVRSKEKEQTLGNGVECFQAPMSEDLVSSLLERERPYKLLGLENFPKHPAFFAHG